MAENLGTLEYVCQFRASDQNAIAYIRKYFALGFGFRLLSCLIRVAGVALVCGIAVPIIGGVVDGTGNFTFDGRNFVIGVYCGMVAFLYSVLINWVWLPFVRGELYKKASSIISDEKVHLELSANTIIWSSSKMRLEVPLEAIIAVRRSNSGITIGVGEAWSRFIPASAFSTPRELEEFLGNLKQKLNPMALLRSAEAFQGAGG